MSAQIIDGRAIASQLKARLSVDIMKFKEQYQCTPQLAVIIVGENPASLVYVRNKRRACEEVGIQSQVHHLSDDCRQSDLIKLIEQLNQDQNIHGILLQLPLPDHMDSDCVQERIIPEKDVDGFHPCNIGRLSLRRPGIRSCTPYGIIKMLDHINVSLLGLNAVVVGASNIVGRPMSMELLLAGCTVTTCHRFTKRLQHHISHADLIVVAIGKPGIVNSKWIKRGAIVIDVGINRLSDGRLVGDIDFATAQSRASWITPVPGGVGPMTVTMLLENTLTVAQQQMNATQ